MGRMIHDHLEGRLPGLIGAQRVWSFAFVHDVANAHVTAMERGRPGAEFMLGGENAPQVRAFEILEQLTGRKRPRNIPYSAAIAAALFEEVRAAAGSRPPQLTRGAVAIFRHDWPLDSRTSIAELDYRITPLDSGIRTLLRSG